MNITQPGASKEEALRSAATARPLHRLGIVRLQQGLSLHKAAQRMNVTIQQVQCQECGTTDLPLSVLYTWQRALNVPIASLLIDVDDSLVSPVLERSQLLRLMKTVLAIHEQARQPSIRRMAQRMCDQLVEIMPELAGVLPWPVGKRRRLSEIGVSAQRCLPELVFIDQGEWSME